MKKHPFSRLLPLLLSAALLGGCAPAGNSLPEKESPVPTAAPSPSALPSPSPEAVDPVTTLLDSMTLQEKVGQLFLVRPEALLPSLTAQQAQANSTAVTAWSPELAQQLELYPVGGVALFGKNLESPQQLSALTAELAQAGSIPLFLAVDEEGGSVARLANHAAFSLPRYQSAAAVAASGNSADARAMGSTIGSYLHQYGFNMDFAPVADVNTNPENPVIGTRAFSPEGETAAIMASAMADGLKEQGIIPTFKHFPGHGDTAEDSHTGLAFTHRTQEEMEQCEWLPYQSLTALDCVMVGHISTPALTGDDTPATLSPQVVTGLLRQELGFEGVVLTDSLSMGAITDTYGSGQAALLALQAGCDILLMPYDLPAAFQAVLTAVENGTLSEARLNESCRRILTLKAAYGMLG